MKKFLTKTALVIGIAILWIAHIAFFGIDEGDDDFPGGTPA